MSGRCRDCKYWDRSSTEIRRGFHDCRLSDKFIYVGDTDANLVAAGDDSLIYRDCEGYAADIQTGPNFGCVHFERREDEKRDESPLCMRELRKDHLGRE